MNWWKNLRDEPKGGYSQINEQNILCRIFEHILPETLFLVDLGASDGYSLSNTRHFLEQGWRGCLIDGAHQTADVHREWITAANILELLGRYEVPERFDLLSIDIDGQDYWVLKGLLGKHHPRVIVAEYNGIFAEAECKTVPYEPKFHFQNHDHYGASYGALCKLARANGYQVLCNNGLNVFFVEDAAAPEGLVPPAYAPTRGWPPAPRGLKWLDV